jgi:acyl-CoA thioester hydrolase
MTPRFSYRHPIEVRFRDCDAMRHVNNAVHFTYLEQARIGYWKALTGSLQIEDLSFVVARAECTYRVPILLGDQVEVRLRVDGLRRSSFSFEYEIGEPVGDRVFASAKTVQVMYDYAKAGPRQIPGELRARMAEFEGAAGPRARS